MPIDDLTDQGAAYPRLGLLRKGGPKRLIKSKKTGKMIEVAGEDLDHFRFVCDRSEVIAYFREVYGDKPRQINVMLPFATVDENLDAWMKEYGAGSLKVKCRRPRNLENGIVLWQDGNGQFHTDAKPCTFPNCACKPYGVLHVIVPELVRVAGIGAVWVLTTSWNDCAELSRNLRAAENSARGLGKDLRGIPFILSRRLDNVSTPPRENGNKRVRSEKWLLHIEPNPVWVAMQIQAFEQLASPLAPAMLEAPEPQGLSKLDQVFIDEEATLEYPETEVVEEVEPEPEPAPETNGQRKYGRADFVARIHALEAEAEALGQPKNVDQSVLDEARLDDLKAIGKSLAAHVEALRAAQAEQEEMELE